MICNREAGVILFGFLTFHTIDYPHKINLPDTVAT